MVASGPLTVAVTGPTGTFGFGLIPLLEADERIGKVVGVARRPFDPTEHGWTKLEYRQGDVRDVQVLESAFADADVVVHLAFLIGGSRNDPATKEINIGGTLNAFRAAAAAGAKRFVYASSVSAYGFAPDLPLGITEQRPVQAADHVFYAQEKAELEQELTELAGTLPGIELYILRPPGVFGPHMLGAKSELATKVMPYAIRLFARLRRFPVKLPMVVPDIRLQLIHHDDVGSAFLQCIVGAGPAGAYNITGDGVVDSADLARVLGLRPFLLRSPRFPRAMRWVARQSKRRRVPDALSWAEMTTVPVIVDDAKAREQLGWKPTWTALETLEVSFAVDR